MRELEWTNINYDRHIYEEDGPFDFDKYINPESVDYINELAYQHNLDYLKDNFGITNQCQANDILHYIQQRQSKFTLNTDELVEEYNQLFGFEAMLKNPAREFIWGYSMQVDDIRLCDNDIKLIIDTTDKLSLKYGYSTIQRACSYDDKVIADIKIPEDGRLKLIEWVHNTFELHCKDDYFNFLCYGRYLNFLLGCYSCEPNAEWEQRCIDFVKVIANENSHPSDILTMARLRYTQDSQYPAALKAYFEPYILMAKMTGV